MYLNNNKITETICLVLYTYNNKLSMPRIFQGGIYILKQLSYHHAL